MSAGNKFGFVMMREWVALCEAQLFCVLSQHATQTFGLCAMVLTQVKALGLVRAFDPLRPRQSMSSRLVHHWDGSL